MVLKFTRLLAFKLFIVILVVMSVATLIFTTVTIDWHSQQYLNSTVESVILMSDVLKRSMHYSMLLNRREDIHQIINTVGSEPGIEVVRIYNKDGVITFSSDSEDVGSVADLADEACKACHAVGKPPFSADPRKLTRVFPSPRGYRVVGAITPIRNEPSCSTAECHAHPASQTVLGVLDVIVPLRNLDQSLAELRGVQTIGAVAMAVAVTAFAGMFIWLMVNIPVRKLTRGTEEIRKGHLNYRIVPQTNDEIGTLAESFNDMAEELKLAREELTRWAGTLEQRVKEKTEQLRQAQSQMIQMEKMASLGTLAATVAHELNNPLEGVLTYAKLLKRKVNATNLDPDARAELLEELSIVADETARCGNIVKNLLLFSRQKIGEFKEVDLCEAVDQSLKLIDHHLRINNIKLEAEFHERPITIMCDPNQIEQALLAIEINAVEAMAGGGTLRVEIGEKKNAEAIQISISDTGIGIHEDDLPHIFEPFFTTKHDGKSTGLGLAVAYGIIERHGGSIDVQSRVGQGTTFTITLPRTLGVALNTTSDTTKTKNA